MPRNGVAGRGRKGQGLCLPGSSENRGPGAPGPSALAGPGGSGGHRGRPGPPGEAGRDLKPPRSLLADRPLWGQFAAQRGPSFTSGSSQFPGPSVPMEPPGQAPPATPSPGIRQSGMWQPQSRCKSLCQSSGSAGQQCPPVAAVTSAAASRLPGSSLRLHTGPGTPSIPGQACVCRGGWLSS